MDFSHSPNSGTFPASVYRLLPWICKWVFECFMPPALARDSYGSGSGRPVRSTPSGQHALARESALHLHLVSATVSGSRSFSRFSLFFPLCFGLVLGSAKGQHMAQIGRHVLQIRHPKVSQIYHLHMYRAQWHSSCGHSLNSNFNSKLSSIMNTHTVGLINIHIHTHSHSFVCEWTLAKNAFGIFNVIYLYHFWLVNNISGVETQLHLFVRYVISCLWVL